MSKSRAVICRGIADRNSNAMQLLNSPGYYARVFRGVPRAIVMKCPDDCGETLTINLDGRTGPAWRIFERAGRLTIYPSVWKDSGCRSHFIVWNDQLLWCDDQDIAAWDDPALLSAVRRLLPPANSPPRHFATIPPNLLPVPPDS